LSRHLSPTADNALSSQLELAFEDNRLAAQLYGDFDQNLALIEQRLAVQATPRGNHVMLKGGASSVDQARRVLESLYGLLEEGQPIEIANVDTMIRMVQTEDSQLTLPTMERKGKVRMAQIATRKATIVARTPAQDAYMRAMERSELVFGVGPAGTGKTYLAVAHAATLLERGDINRIILSRPAVEAGERLGFLPGDMKDKVDPYLRPLYDALYDMMRPEHVERCITSGIIEVAPLAFMRGRTLANAVVILDEAQNTTSMQMKMFLTRLGENSKMIVTGDPTQVDLPPGQKSGLVEALHLLDGIEGVHISRFSDKDVVRHALVGRIVRAYEGATAKEDKAR
jgi:phosphate starvation-inducible PhoH-like protein